MNLQDIRDAIVADGEVDIEEVHGLRAHIYADDTIDREEAVVLFEINNATSGNPNNVPEWNDLFVDAITDYVLQDEETPGVVSDDEAAFLIEQIGADGDVDELEQRLLYNIEDTADSIPANLLDFLDSRGL